MVQPKGDGARPASAARRYRNKGGRKSGKPITLAGRSPDYLPEDWQPNSSDLKSAQATGFSDRDIGIEVARFKEACEGRKNDSWSVAWREWCRSARGRKIIVSPSGGAQHVNVNRRESILEYWLGRNLISPQEYDAGSEMRADWEKVTLGGGRGHDYSQPYVDGNPPRDPLRDAQLEASARLKRVALALGSRRFSILVHLVGLRSTITSAATVFGCVEKYDVAGFAIEAREALRALAVLKGSRPARS